MAALIKDGISFSATRSVVHLVEFNLCTLIVGRFLGPGQVAIFLVMASITMAFRGLLIMVSTPYWAALVDARAKGDQRWIIASTRNYYGYLIAIVGLAAIVLIPFGPFIIVSWYGPEFVSSRILFVAHMLFLFAVGWRSVNCSVCIGLDRLHQTVKPILRGLACGLVLGTVGMHLFGLWAMFVGLAIGTLMIPGIKLPALVWKEFRDLKIAMRAMPQTKDIDLANEPVAEHVSDPSSPLNPLVTSVEAPPTSS